MLRRPLLLFFIVAACSRKPAADLPYIKDARSLGAEWALVNEQAREGHLTTIYVRTMRKNLREQLQATAKSLSDPRSPYGLEIVALAREPEDAPPKELRVHAMKLKHIEDSLESA